MAIARTKTASPPNITLKRLAAELTESHAISEKQAHTMLTDLVGLMVKHLKKGARVHVFGLGTLQVKERAGRMGRNPWAATMIPIRGNKLLVFSDGSQRWP
jgi:DNA-binding protein HU-beta